MLDAEASTTATVGVAALGHVEQRFGVADAAAVLTIAEEHDELTPAGRRRRRERHGEAVEDGAAPRGADRGQGRVGGRRRLAEVYEAAHAHVEGEEPQPVARAEVSFQLP